MPAGWAFAIWGIIYTFITIFVVYQSLPPGVLNKRNDDLIFDKIGYLFSINMTLNGVWLLIFGFDEPLAFGLSMIVMFGILITTIEILRASHRSKVNFFEAISLRVGFSIYGGWVTAATILNISIFLKSVGFDSDEEFITQIILSIAFLIYFAFALAERDPLFGGVFIWVLISIRAR